VDWWKLKRLYRYRVVFAGLEVGVLYYLIKGCISWCISCCSRLSMMRHSPCCLMDKLFLAVALRVIVSVVMVQREIMTPLDEGVSQRSDHGGFTWYIRWRPWSYILILYHLPFTKSVYIQFKMSHVSHIIRRWLMKRHLSSTLPLGSTKGKSKRKYKGSLVCLLYSVTALPICLGK